VRNRKGQPCLKLQFLPVSTSFLVLSTRLRICLRRPLNSKSKAVPTDLNWCVGLVSLLSCALTPLLPRRTAKRDRLHAALRANESREEEENQSIEPRDPKKKSVYELQSSSLQLRQGVCITQSQGSMSKPILRSALKCPREIGQRVIGRAFRQRETYINECGCVVSNVRFGGLCLCVCLSCLRSRV
jgi:hypothetical protein